MTSTVHIEFDGGTPCNIQRLGLGIGYGSYRIDSGEVVRVNHGKPMTCNVAEVMTLVVAIESLTVVPQDTELHISGDSKIALGRCHPKKKRTPLKFRKAAPDYLAACETLEILLRDFAKVETHWRGRAASVNLFGH